MRKKIVMAIGRWLTAIFLLLFIALVLAVAIYPMEFVRFARDRRRTDDLKKLNKVIGKIEAETPEAVLAKNNLVYISLPDNDSHCAAWQGKLPPLPLDFSYHCSSKKTYRLIDGRGWLPINFSLLASSLSFDKLPIDPANGKLSNDEATGKKRLLFYQYIKGSFSLGAFSEKPPQIDAIYSETKQRTAIKVVSGVESTEIGIGGGGQMIIAGKPALINKANAAAIALSGKKVEREAAEKALKQIKEAVDRLELLVAGKTAGQVAAVLLKELNVPLEKVPAEARREIKRLKRQPAEHFVKKVVERRIKETQEEVERQKQRLEEETAKVLKEKLPTAPLTKAQEKAELPTKSLLKRSLPPQEKKAVIKKPEKQPPEERRQLTEQTPETPAEAPTEETPAEEIPMEKAPAEEVPPPTAPFSSCPLFWHINGAKLTIEELRSRIIAGDKDGDGLTDEKEKEGAIATSPDNPDTDGDCLTDGAEVLTYHTNPARSDTDGDFLKDRYEIQQYGSALQIHPFLTNKEVENEAEFLSNKTLVNLLLTAGFLTDGGKPFAAPAVLNPFYPDRDGDGKGDGWEVFVYHTNPSVAD